MTFLFRFEPLVRAISRYAQKQEVSDGVVDNCPQWCLDTLELHVSATAFISMLRQRVYEGAELNPEHGGSEMPEQEPMELQVTFASDSKSSGDGTMAKRVRGVCVLPLTTVKMG